MKLSLTSILLFIAAAFAVSAIAQDDFEEELDDDYEIEIDDEISAEFGLNTASSSDEEEDDDDVELDDFEDFDNLHKD